MRLTGPSRLTLAAGVAQHPVSAVCVAICCTLVLAACGSANTPSAAQTGAGASRSLVNYSACMRSHGVSDFPDPSTSQGPNAMGIDGYNFNLPANLNLQSPAYESAQKACGNLIGAGSGASRTVPAAARQAALAHSECMRRHGVPNFPDPTFSSDGAGISVRSGGPGLNPRSPAFQHAQKICQPAVN